MYLLLAAVLIAADQLSKLWVKSRLPLGGEGLELGFGFSLTYIRNTGAAFGTLRDLSLTLGGITLDGTRLLGLLSASVTLVLLIFLLTRAHRLGALQVIALTLILSGAAGNMIDRLRLGFVVDFVHFQVGRFDFPVFNLADSCVVIGAALWILHELLPKRLGVGSGPPYRI
ncbi:MAG: signal peptidase II [Truepera sp.]|nr:signal peptidase II [Truepera sp.]